MLEMGVVAPRLEGVIGGGGGATTAIADDIAAASGEVAIVEEVGS